MLALVTAGKLERAGIRTVSHLMQVQPVPAGCQPARRDLDMDQHTCRPLCEGRLSDRCAFHAEHVGAGRHRLKPRRLRRLGGSFDGLDFRRRAEVFDHRFVGRCVAAGREGQHTGGRKISSDHRDTPVDSWIGIGQTGHMSESSIPQADRADKMLVALGHFGSRAAAQAAISAGLVLVDGKPVAKPSEMISRDAEIQSEAAHPYVSRGGLKLARALSVFAVDPAGLDCLDLGASTGGFTDVLLRAGAARVTCVDVGHGQLHARIAGDDRVTSYERLNARDLKLEQLAAPPQLIVCDLSFVSLAKVLDVPLALAAPDARLIALFKPQFEVGPENVGKGGLVTDMLATDAALGAFLNYLIAAGWRVQAPQPSPIPGRDGNKERLDCA